MILLKRKCRYFDQIFVTGCTGSCQNNNFLYRQQFSSKWRHFRFSAITISSDIKLLETRWEAGGILVYWLLVGVYSHSDNLLWSFQTLLALHADILPDEEYLSPQKIVEYIGSRTAGGRDATQSIGKAEFMQCATVSKTMAAILEVGWGPDRLGHLQNTAEKSMCKVDCSVDHHGEVNAQSWLVSWCHVVSRDNVWPVSFALQ